MRRAFVFRRPFFRIVTENIQSLFQTLQTHRQLPQFPLQFESYAVQLLEIVLHVRQR